MIDDHAETTTQAGPSGRPRPGREHHLAGTHRAVRGPHHGGAGALECRHRGSFEDPDAAVQRDPPEAAREPSRVHHRTIATEPAGDEAGGIRDRPRGVETDLAQPRSLAAGGQERGCGRAFRFDLPAAGRDLKRSFVVIPGIDPVLLEPAADLLDGARHRPQVPHAVVVAERRADRRRIPPRRGEEAPVAAARPASADVLFDEGDAQRRVPRGELDRRPEAGEPSAYDADVGHHVGGERRTLLTRVVCERFLQPVAARRPRSGNARAHTPTPPHRT